MTARDRLLEALAEDRDDLVAFCRTLVQIRSEDPPGDNRAICSHIADYLLERGVPSRTYGSDPGRPNLIAQIPLASPGPRIVLNGHMETLPVGDLSTWSYEPFGGTITGGRLYGRGAYCMKSGLAVLISAALALRDHADDLPGTLTLMCVSDEVNGGRLGTAYVLDHVAEAHGDVALIGESSSGINFGHKGALFVEFQASGDGGHGAYTFARSSATHRMIEVLQDVRRLDGALAPSPPDIASRIEELRGLTDATHGPGATDALMRLSANVGVVQGGRKVNVVADACAAQVDFRLPPGMTIEELLQKLHSIVERHPGVTFRTLSACEPTASSPDHPWFQALQRSSREVLGEPLPFRFSHGFTDARFFRLRGIPAAAVGVRGGNVGAPNEYIEIESLVEAARLVALSAYDYLKSS